MADLSKLVINERQILVTPITDYFAVKANAGKFDDTIREHDEFNVGIVEKVGEALPAEWVGHIIYYHTGVGLKVRVKEIGDYHYIGNDHKILVRMDQSRSDY
jgi:hypothetical protein